MYIYIYTYMWFAPHSSTAQLNPQCSIIFPSNVRGHLTQTKKPVNANDIHDL